MKKQRSVSRSGMACGAAALAAAMFATVALPMAGGFKGRASAAEEVPVKEGLQLWLDASDLSLADGASVQTWTNKVTPDLDGSGDAVQQTAARAPVYTESSTRLGGHPAVTLSSSSYMRVGGATGFYLDDMTIIVVGSFDYRGGTEHVLSRLAANPSNHNWFFNLENNCFNYGWGVATGNVVSYHQVRSSVEWNKPTVFLGRKSGSEGMNMTNGAVQGKFVGSSPADVKTPVYLGDPNSPTARGDVGEILIYNRGLGDDELKQVNNYLFRKWSFEETDGAALDDITYGGETITGFSPYVYDYNVLADGTPDPAQLSAAARYAEHTTIEKKEENGAVVFKVTNTQYSLEKTYRVSFYGLPAAADRLERLGLDEVQLGAGFWKDLIGQYVGFTLGYIYDMYDFSESFLNFDRYAEGERKLLNNTSQNAGTILAPSGNNRFVGDREGTWARVREPWREGLIYEEIRAAANFIAEYADDPDWGERVAAVEERTRGYIARIVAAGCTATGIDGNGRVIDGYFDTYVQLTQRNILDEAEEGALGNHDLYNFGCLIEAAVSWYEATGETDLLFIATRWAEFLVDYMYGENGYLTVPPHEIGEEAILELYILYHDHPGLVAEMESRYDSYSEISPADRYYKLEIREEQYLQIARDWVEKRGVYEGRANNTNYGEYAQDQAPYTQQTRATGHAVRANLWYSAIAGIGNYLDDKSYLETANTIWNNIVEHQMYITGGTGSVHSGEAYSADDYLPHDGYCETCAAVAMGFFAANMNEAFADGKYADVFELELYNGILGCLGTDGMSFYYTNPVASSDYVRPLWSGATPCCPPMYMKFFSLLPTYIYAGNAEKLVVNQYISSVADTTVGGTKVSVSQWTDMPDGNRAVFEVTATGSFAFGLRVPSWAQSVTLRVNGASQEAEAGADGYILLERDWSGTTTVDVTFGKEVERVYQNNAAANSKQVAFRYGSFIYCAETEDNLFGSDISATAVVSPEAELRAEWVDDLFTYTLADGESFTRGTNVIRAAATAGGADCTLTLIPFYLRSNRSKGGMTVWIWEISTEVAGGAVTTNELADFTLYPAGGFREEGGAIVSGASSEMKAIWNGGPLTEFRVSVDLIPEDVLLNGGIYLYASEPSATADRITALNVQIERLPASQQYYSVKLFEFSASGGYLGSLSEVNNLAWPANNTIHLEITAVDGILTVATNGVERMRYGVSAEMSGAVGLRSQFAAVRYQNFRVLHSGIALHKEGLQAAIAQAEAIDAATLKSASKTALEAALADARSALETAVNDDLLDRAVERLNAALAALETCSDTSALEAVIAEAKAIDRTKYTEQSLAALDEALGAAEALSGDNTAEELEAARANLADAIEQLIEKSSEPQNTQDDGTNTGLYIGLGVGLGVAALAAGGGTFLFLRKRRK